ncbi:MAG: hypothetical protein JW797_20565 [Bradymonadales bacterium]|nr:hypothetical protein [Bradymonadales bacterium]
MRRPVLTLLFLGILAIAACSDPVQQGGPVDHDIADASSDWLEPQDQQWDQEEGLDPFFDQAVPPDVPSDEGQPDRDEELDLLSDGEDGQVDQGPFDQGVADQVEQGDDSVGWDLEDWGGDGELDGSQPEVPLAGFGTISGSCGVLSADEILLGDPELYFNHLDFGSDSYDHPEELELLSEGGQVIATIPNAGGSSICSEVFAYEMLYRCELAWLTHTETQIFYDPSDSSMTDMRVEIDGYYLGVSVVRAMLGPGVPYTYEEAVRILRKKLEGIQESSQNVLEEYRWEKQILAVLAYSDQHADLIQQAYEYFESSEPDLLDDTLVMVTTTDGDDDFIYYSCPID